MKIAVVGIGGIGGYYGGLLARHYSGSGDVEIVFIARGRNLEKIKSKGLQLLSEKGEFTIKPDLATDDPKDCGTIDSVFFCVKGYDLESAAKLVAPNVNDNTVVISLLNGVDNADRLRGALPKGKIFNGCVYISAYIVEPGLVRQAGGSCKLFFGDGSYASEDGENVERVLKAAGIDADYRKDIDTVVWEKYIFICPFAGATTFLGKTIPGVLDDTDGRKLLEGLLREVLDIAKAQNITMPDNIEEITIRKASVFPYETKTSMQTDFEKGKKVELDTFTGYIVREGRKRGIAVPHHEKVYEALVKRLSS